MIRAAVACAAGDGPPPPELTLAWQCQQFGALPYAGGLSEQPAGLLDRMTAANNSYNAWRGYIQAPHKNAWIADNPQGWKIVQEIISGKLHH